MVSQLLDPTLIALKAEHAPRLDRQTFDERVAKLWPQASKLALWKVSGKNRDAMYAAHVAFGLSPVSIVAGFAEAYKSGVMR